MNSSSDSSVAHAAQVAFDYLAATDPLPSAPVDAVIGFGVFDLSLPRYCGRLFRENRSRHVIFTGGIGAGTADLGGPEAEVWRDELLRADPQFPIERLVLESRSTQTTENIQFTTALLKQHHPQLAFGSGVRAVIIVASPSRLRRVKLALMRWHPELQILRSLPPTNFAREQKLYASKGHDYLTHLTGELDRLVSYPAKGWIASEPLPPDVARAHAILRAHIARQVG